MDLATLDRLLDVTIETIRAFDFGAARRYAGSHAGG
jgi:hypothetical protein